MERVATHGGMLSVSIIIIKDKKLWGIRRGGKHTNIFYRGNRNVRWKCIRGISGCFGGREISAMVMGGRFRYGIKPSTGNLFLNQS